MSGWVNRRTVLSSAGAGGLAAATGCLVAETDPPADLRNRPTVVVRRFYALAAKIDSSTGFARAVEPILHSVSPLQSVLKGRLGQWRTARRSVVESIAIVAENIAPDQVVDRSSFSTPAVADAAASLAEENVVVEATLDVSNVPEFGIDRRTQSWFLATEAGEWRLVWF